MKRIILAIALGCSLLLLPACTTINKAAYKTTQGTSIAADVGLQVWADYVSRQKSAGMPVPLSQELQAKKSWDAFQDARDGVIRAGIAYSQAKAAGVDLSVTEATINASVAAMAAASADFINLLASFGVKVQ